MDIKDKRTKLIAIAVILVVAILGFKHFTNPARTFVGQTFYASEEMPTSFSDIDKDSTFTFKKDGTAEVSGGQDMKVKWDLKGDIVKIDILGISEAKINLKDVQKVDGHKVYKMKMIDVGTNFYLISK
jgi:hypothetical protein